MSEEQVLALLKSINIKIESLQAQIMMFQEALQPHREHTTRVEEEVEKVGKMIQDFKGVTIMLETDKAYLVIKNGHQRWVAKSHLTEGYELGSNVDLKLTDDALKWVPEKPWDKYVPQKKGG